MESMKKFGFELKNTFSSSKAEGSRRMTWNIPDMKLLKENLFNEISDYVNKEMGKMSDEMNEAFDGFEEKRFSSENV